MLRIFFTIWFLVIAVLIYFLFPNPLSITGYVERQLVKTHVITTVDDVFILLEHQLERCPASEREVAFNKIADQFYYKISLIPIDSENITDEERNSLLQNQYVGGNTNDNFEEITYVRKRFFDTELVINMFLDETEEQSTLSLAKGYFYLIESDLNRQPSTKWPQMIADYQRLGMDVDIKPINTLSLPEDKKNALVGKGVTWNVDDEQYTTIYRKLADNQVLLLGPYPLPGETILYELFIYATFFTFITLAVLIFIVPFWRDLKKLEHAATRFGEGELDSRAKIGKRSNIYQLSASFDQMANSIGTMINENRSMSNALAHDLRTPLARLRFATEMLEDDNISQTQKDDYKHIINSSISTLEHLIQQVLVLSRYQRAIDISRFEHCLLADVLKEEIATYKIENPDLSIKLLIDDSLLDQSIFADKRAILRLLRNLVDNAIRYAKERVDIHYKQIGDEYSLSVSDDGSGIPEAIRNDVFKAFFQQDNPERKMNSQHGLGLAIVQQIALWHGGSVEISTALIGGANIEFKWKDKTANKN